MKIQNVTLSIAPGETAFTFAVTVAGQFVFSDDEINAVPQQKFRLSISLYADDKENDNDSIIEAESEYNKKLYAFSFRGWPSAYAVIKPKQHVQDFSVTRIIDGSILDEDGATFAGWHPNGQPLFVAHKDEVYARVVLSYDHKYNLQLAIARSNIVIGQFGLLGNVVDD